MKIEDFYRDNPDLYKIDVNHLIRVTKSKSGINLNINETLFENGLDDLDLIEIIIQIETDLNISIQDEFIEYLHVNNFSDIISEIRKNKLKKIGIE